MTISLIVALDERGGIGYRGGLPWHLPDDLKRFKRLTMGNHLIMGRKTWESIARPLPGRSMSVISRRQLSLPPGVLLAHSLQQALSQASQSGGREIFVSGGAQVYAQALPLAQRMYLTRLHAIYPADVYFPAFDPADWLETGQEDHPADERHACAFTFIDLVRRLPVPTGL